MRLLVTILLLMGSGALAQTIRPWSLPAGVEGQAWILGSRYAPFPDSLRRVTPRVYEGKTYAWREHYNDSSVLVFVPAYMNPAESCAFVHWFHGWFNNIDSSVRRFRLLEQFYAARRNAVFIFPQGPYNAPDSYAGKWESPVYFLPFTAEWWETLRTQSARLYTLKRGRQVFAGHSGAYRLISRNLLFADDVLLFDGLYNELDAFFAFVQAGNDKRLLHIYTDDGGTRDNSLQFLQRLDKAGIAYLHKEEDAVTDAELRQHRIVFLHSRKGHNEVITHHQNLERFLRAWN